MGIEHTHPPKYWRKRADWFRSKANDCTDQRTRQSLRSVAERYQTLAQLAELPRSNGPRANQWSEIEIAQLRALAGTMPLADLAKELGRSESAIRTKACSLRIFTRQRSEISPRQYREPGPLQLMRHAKDRDQHPSGSGQQP